MFWLPLVSVDDPAAKRQLSFGSELSKTNLHRDKNRKCFLSKNTACGMHINQNRSKHALQTSYTKRNGISHYSGNIRYKVSIYVYDVCNASFVQF